MNELLPYQEKRKKKVQDGLSAYEAVTNELTAYYRAHLPELKFDLTAFAQAIAPVTSPALISDPTLAWDETRLQAPLTALLSVQSTTTDKQLFFPKRRYEFLPKPYQKKLKRVYSSLKTLDLLAAQIGSKRKAKRIIRILHKRLGLYTKKKVKLTARDSVLV